MQHTSRPLEVDMIGSQAQIATDDIVVSTADSADNVDIVDVIGSKTDTFAGDSIYSRLDEVYDNLNLERKVYPTLAAGATVVSAAADWTLGAYAEVVPASTVTNNFHVLNVSIESMDKNAVFQLELYKGAGDDLITSVRFAVVGGFWGNSVYMVGAEEVEANARIRARLASSDGSANQATATISICYYEHV